MRKILALLLCLLASPAAAQVIGSGHVLGNAGASAAAPTDTALSALFDTAFCATNGQFLSRSAGFWVCATTPAVQIANQTFAAPGAVNTLTLTNTPLPTAANQITVFFDGIAQHPDTWSIVISTGVITFNANIPANVQEVFIQWTSPNITTAAVTSVGGLNGVILCGVGLDCTTVSQTLSSQGPVYADVKIYGAKGDCSTDDTTAFQNAVNAAAAAGGAGIVYVPPVASGKCYLVGAINATALPHLTIRGNGDESLIEVNGYSSTNHIWWDGSGSNDVSFENLKIASNGSSIPAVLFLFAGTSVTQLISGIHFRHVNIDSKWTQAAFYGYNIVPWSAGTTTGVGGFSCDDSTWILRENGSSNANASLRNSAGPVLDGINSRSIASDYVTVSTAHSGSNSAIIKNCNFIDAPSGFGNGTRDNNISLVMVNAGQMSMYGGSIETLGDSASAFYTNTESVELHSVVFENTDGSGNTAHCWMIVGGGSNGEFSLQNVFFSVPAVNGGFICNDAPVGGAGGFTELTVTTPDVGGNTNNAYFILDYGGCTGFTPGNDWLVLSYLQLSYGANNIALCGSIDSHTILVNPGTVALVGGASDNSHHF